MVIEKISILTFRQAQNLYITINKRLVTLFYNKFKLSFVQIFTLKILQETTHFNFLYALPKYTNFNNKK